jgi:hypothetical protein
MRDAAGIREKDGAASAGSTPRREDFGALCFLVVAGSVAACVVAWLWCEPPLRHRLSWAGVALRCAWFLAVTAAAGAAGIWGGWLALGSKPAFARRTLFEHALMGWMFLPGAALLARTWPAWGLPVMAVGAAAMAVSLRPLAAAVVADDEPEWKRGEFRSLYGTRITGFRPRRALAMAGCVWGAVGFAAAEDYLPAGILLGAGFFLLLWHWCGEVGIAAIDRRRESFGGGTVAGAVLVLLMALLPWLARRGDSPGGALRMQTAQAAERADASARVRPHFSSVILWPPAQRVTELYFPSTHARSDADRMTKPLEIRFDGPYWYFEPPDDSPGETAHIAHGLPTDARVNMASADDGPLRMEAVERLAKPIRLSCCGELDVAVTNADAQAGPVHLGVLLRDESSPDEFMLLGFQPVASSEPGFSGRRGLGTEETVRFEIPRTGPLRRFNQITVMVVPSVDAWRGTKVAIEGFTLLPR